MSLLSGDDQQSHVPAPAIFDTDTQLLKLTPFLPTTALSYRLDTRVMTSHRMDKFTKIKPLTMPRDYNDPPQWTFLSHPEGQPYFVKDRLRLDSSYNQSGWRSYALATEANMYHDKVVQEVVKLQERMEGKIREHWKDCPESFDIVICPRSTVEWEYYMVEDRSRSVFWLDEYNAPTNLDGPSQETDSPSHSKYYMDYQYWKHLELYPHLTRVEPSYALDELSSILIHGETNIVTSRESTVYHTIEEFHSTLKLVESMKLVQGDKSYVITCIGSLMAMFAYERYLNSHSQYNAQLSHHKGMSDEKRSPLSLSIRVLSPFLFFGPETHFRELERVFVNKRFSPLHCRRFFESLKGEWVKSIIYSMILLPVNISFMAVQGTATVGQFASFISIIASIASVATSFLIGQQHCTITNGSDKIVAKDLDKGILPFVGLEAVAIMYSLPYALLMWGMIMFFVAILAMGYDTANGPQRLVVVVAWGIVSYLIASTIQSNWDLPTDTLRNPIRLLFEKGPPKTGDGSETLDECQNPATELSSIVNPGIRHRQTLSSPNVDI